MRNKWKPSKSALKEFCAENNIQASYNNDSYYFILNGQKYRVSNHSVESSNNAAFHDIYGQVRELYHPDGRESDVIYIHASKTRIIEIYNDLKSGYTLDGNGRRKIV